MCMKEGRFGMLNSRADRNSEQTKRAIAKYEERGFELASTSIQWLPHYCGDSAYCPHTMRNVMDGDGFVYPLVLNMDADDIARALCPYVPLSLFAVQVLNSVQIGPNCILAARWTPLPRIRSQHVFICRPRLMALDP